MGALLLVGLAARAEAGVARLRWMPSPDPRVTGYHVFVRRAGVGYPAPFDARRPAPAADGSMAYDVTGVVAGQTYYFGVTAYTATALESGLTGELALGATNACIVDRCTTPTACEFRVAADDSSCDDGLFCNGIAVCEAGVCVNGPAPSCADGVACTTDRCDETLARCVHVGRPNCCAIDADCADTDACTSAERCVAGTCVSTGATCPTSSCAADACDPVAGCGLLPTPDGVSCDESCDALEPRRLVVNASSKGATLNLKSRFTSAAFIDPSVTGMTLELIDASGAVAYRATVPAERIASKRAGTKFRYLASAAEAESTSGLFGIVLRQRRGVWTLNVRASSLDLFDALAQTQLGLTIRFGNACVRDAELACDADGEHAACR